MQYIDLRQFMELSGATLPLSILLIENDEDRQFLTEMYLQYRPLMYKIASQFFSDNYAEMEDAVGGAVERLCKKCETLRQVTCNKRASYIVSTVRNVCLTRLREIGLQRRSRDYAQQTQKWLTAFPAKKMCRASCLTGCSPATCWTRFLSSARRTGI